MKPIRFVLLVALPLTASAAPGSSAARLADVDGDGDLDRLELDFDALVVHETRGDGSVVRRYLPDESGEDEYTAFELADLDDDGAVDVLAVGENNLFGRDCALARWHNDGTGRFAWSRLTSGSFGWACDDLALGDLDGDGDLDAVAAEVLDGRVHLFVRSGTAYADTTLPGFSPSCPDFTRAVALADLDGDGRADLLCGTQAPPAAALVLRVERHGAPAQELVLAAPAGGLVAATSPAELVDADGDGDLDVVVQIALASAGGRHVSGGRHVAANDGQGRLGPLVHRP